MYISSDDHDHVEVAREPDVEAGFKGNFIQYLIKTMKKTKNRIINNKIKFKKRHVGDRHKLGGQHQQK